MLTTRALLLTFLLGTAPASATDQSGASKGATSAFTTALEGAERAIASGDNDKAHALVIRALERDARSLRAWAVRAKWAAAAKDQDELVYALHTGLRLAIAQKAPKAEVQALRDQVLAADPIAKDLFGMNAKFIGTLEPLANAYEKDGRPHSAIRVHKLILALDPEYAASQAAIDRISSLPDPSLAGDAKPKDLLADVSAEWIRDFDAKHATWDDRAKLERENYTTYTNAGYEVLVRAAEAMEQMNRFYRVFFQYGTPEDHKSVSRINLNIFKLRDEYLTLGEGPPVKWSGGHFTGNAVETYVEGNGFAGMTNTLFHEAAHQFVSLSTRAAGWLNEGLASFFEGCRILPNGTVLMNMPATQRLFPLAARMEKGWMSSASDGIDPKEASKSEPEKAPTFRIVIENEYEWGPPWYAPTWGVVFFLYNFQDPVDGRFVYRRAFREYIDASGGLQGKTAVGKFEETVLAHPLPPIKGVDRKGAPDLVLPKTIDQLDATWKQWIIELRDEQIGKTKLVRPYLPWARAALIAKDDVAAQEHFEKGLVQSPRDVELLAEFAAFLADHKNADRATKLALAALQVLENAKPVDVPAVARFDKLLAKFDPKRATIEKAQDELRATTLAIVTRYREAKLPMLVMDVSWRLGTDLQMPELYAQYRAALKESGKSLALFELAYDEKSLAGWDTGGNDAFKPAGVYLDAQFKEYAADQFDYQVLTLDRVTAGDFSLEADLLAARGETNFCGLVFGRKDTTNFHAFIYFPGGAKAATNGAAESAWVDLASFYDGGATKTWRHNPVEADAKSDKTTTSRSRKLRIDVAGTTVDCWVDGELVATHEFASRDVLSGTFGLIQGRGKARFQDVRFLARDPRDPASALEREVRMEKLKASGTSVGGSWLGQVPPFPAVKRWVQAPRTSWDEKGYVPQLLVFWSIPQNELIPLHAWLTSIQQNYAAVGLAIVAITSPNDMDTVDEYLKTHAFPGSVGVDDRVTPGMGTTHELYAIPKFNLPRILLLDIDGKVAWEGDPGFKINVPWTAGEESFLDAPLAELVAKRKLAKQRAWMRSWSETGAAELAAGEIEKAWPKLLAAREFDGEVLPLAYEVQRKALALEAATKDLAGTAAELAASGRAPALRTLLAWARVLNGGKDVKQPAQLKPVFDGAAMKDWDRALSMAASYAPRIAKKAELATEFADKLAPLQGAFPGELAAAVRAAGDDGAAIAAVLGGAAGLPQRWLVEHLGLN